MKVLVIAEKPSVGKDIARVLQCKGRADGYLFSDEFIITWAIGHLVELYAPEDYDARYKKWGMQALPIVPAEIKLKAIKKTRAQLAVIHRLMNNKEVGSLICATDAGREGELIFRYIYTITQCNKPFKRLWISSMTDKAIKDGFANLRDGAEYDNLYWSAKCRSEADWLVGINASRAYTLRYNALFSVGRVQTPTLAIIVNRQKEIDAFKPMDYWELTGVFETADSEKYTGLYIDTKSNAKNETKIYDKKRAEEIANKVKGGQGIVKRVEEEEKRQPPPLLYDLTELQRDANKRYGLSASKALEIAQSLYEKRKLITYPRTDSRYLSDDMRSKLSSVMEKLAATHEYGDFSKRAIDGGMKAGKRIIDDSKISDHHAIIPTDISINLTALTTDEAKIYDLIAIRFIAAFYDTYIYNITRVITEVCGESFLTKGTAVAKLGWMELYARDEKKDEQFIPNVSEGEGAALTDARISKKKTQPPKPYTDASLLSAMENAGKLVEDEELRESMKDSGLGTPATRAAIIERLITVGYIERKAKAFVVTEKGISLIAAVAPELRSPDTTGKWEKGLTSISKGKMDAGRFMGSIVRYVNYIVATVKEPKHGQGADK